MKKKYEKPQFLMENFEVAEFVAGVCDLDYVGLDGKKNSTTPEQCNAYWDDFPTDKVFMTVTPSTCEFNTDKHIDGLCYNNPDNKLKTFLS